MAFGVPVELANDGGPEYTSKAFGDFLARWGVRLRVSSAYHASSNGRAEAAVKTTKRALRDNTGPDGQLDTDMFTRALLLLRNTPDREITGRTAAGPPATGRAATPVRPQTVAHRERLPDRQEVAGDVEREGAGHEDQDGQDGRPDRRQGA